MTGRMIFVLDIVEQMIPETSSLASLVAGYVFVHFRRRPSYTLTLTPEVCLFFYHYADSAMDLDLEFPILSTSMSRQWSETPLIFNTSLSSRILL
ncbi:hypothetical protein BPAE_0053g00110 [Botrytis paeoniae]|uniref:Uncharacterized protein n=1 Tax=Botrytis paeoniae TaxID=278948 RepID=A0A4Z1FSZ0_9HELO|nr:hypothetical protein BPAE_0053g00110 [Botrytis paeoniae]